MAFILNKNNIMYIDSTPKILLKEEDFINILTNKEIRYSLLDSYNVEYITVGVLKKTKEDNMFICEDINIENMDIPLNERRLIHAYRY